MFIYIYIYIYIKCYNCSFYPKKCKTNTNSVICIGISDSGLDTWTDEQIIFK